MNGAYVLQHGCKLLRTLLGGMAGVFRQICGGFRVLGYFEHGCAQFFHGRSCFRNSVCLRFHAFRCFIHAGSQTAKGRCEGRHNLAQALGGVTHALCSGAFGLAGGFFCCMLRLLGIFCAYARLGGAIISFAHFFFKRFQHGYHRVA